MRATLHELTRSRVRAQHSARLSFRLILDDLKLRAILESGCNVRKFTQRDRDNAKDDTLSPSLSTEGYMGAEWYWIPCNHHSSPCIRALNSRIPLGLLRVLLIVRFLSFARRRSRTSDHRRETIKRVINSAKISALWCCNFSPENNFFFFLFKKIWIINGF